MSRRRLGDDLGLASEQLLLADQHIGYGMDMAPPGVSFAIAAQLAYPNGDQSRSSAPIHQQAP
jgi:hypothetical protein